MSVLVPIGDFSRMTHLSVPATAGSVSGVLSTAQQAGNSIGVAVTGLLFFGALGHGYSLAFERSVLQMGALLLMVAALTRLMPARTSGAR